MFAYVTTWEHSGRSAISHVVHNLPWIAWGGLLGWLLAKAHRGWVVNLLRRRMEGLLVENTRLRRRQDLRSGTGSR